MELKAIAMSSSVASSSAFLMYRMELKDEGLDKMVKALELFKKFLMYRVELKDLLKYLVKNHHKYWEFLMYRVELKELLTRDALSGNPS